MVSKPSRSNIVPFAPSAHDDLPDDALVKLAVDNDSDAFRALMERYARMVIAIARAKTSSATEAEDIAQDTFVEAYRRLEDIREPGKFRAWLTTIALNKINAFHRSSGRNRNRLRQVYLDDEGLSRVPDARPDPSAVANSDLIKGLVMSAIAKLEPKIGDVVYLKLIEELSSGEIAKRLRISESATRMRLMRGLNRIRRTLEAKGLDQL